MSRDRGRDDYRGSSRDGYGDERGRGMSSDDRQRDTARQRVSLLIRNLPLDCRVEDVRAKFERYGEIRDVYMPRDYYTQRSRGFGFIEFRDTKDAEDAMYALDRSIIGGREVSVVLSKESRKTPREMIKREDVYKSDEPVRSTRHSSRSRSPRRASRGHSRGHTRSASRSPRRGHSGSRSRSPRARSVSRSRSPARPVERERSSSPKRERSRDRE